MVWGAQKPRRLRRRHKRIQPQALRTVTSVMQHAGAPAQSAATVWASHPTNNSHTVGLMPLLNCRSANHQCTCSGTCAHWLHSHVMQMAQRPTKQTNSALRRVRWVTPKRHVHPCEKHIVQEGTASESEQPKVSTIPRVKDEAA
jgi:hypothetical protein